MASLADSIVNGLKSFFDNVVTAVSNVVVAVGTVAKDVVSGVADWFKKIIKSLGDLLTSLGDWFTDVGAKVASIPKSIVDGFMDLLKALFLPADGFLNDKINSLKATLAGRFHMETYHQMMNALQGYVSGKLNFKGYIDLSPWLGDHFDTLKDFLRAFFYPLILLGDFKFLLWVIRGSTISGTAGGGGSD